MTGTMKALRSSLAASGKIDQSMLRYVLGQGRDCIKILSPEGTIEYINSEGQCALNVTDFSKVCGSYWPDFWPEDSCSTVEVALLAAARGHGSTFEAWRDDGQGEKRWWQVSVSPLVEASGELVAILTISRDITDLVRLRETERTLALEMRHRLRNAYTVASAIVAQSARGDELHRGFAETVTARLADVALSQTRLLEAGGQSWTLADLIRTLVEAHGSGAEGVRFAGPASVTVNGQEALLIALVLGELTNNSLKYGALRAGKQLKLSWCETDRLAIRWREPLVAPLERPLGARSQGSGYSLMTRMAQSLRATFEFEADERELRATLRLPHCKPSK